MSKSPDEKSLLEQAQALEAIVKKGNNAVSGVNNLFTFGHNIETLVSELHKHVNKGSQQSQGTLFWSNKNTAPLPFDVRAEQKRMELYNAQQQVSMLVTDNPGIAASDLASSASALSSVNPAALVITSAVTLIDAYLTRRALRQGVREIKEALNEGLADLKWTLNDGIERVTSTLNQGFIQVTETLQAGFKGLDSRFAWGFSEIMWRIDQQSDTSEKILHALVYVTETMAYELRERGIRSYNYGWYPEALADLHDAFEKARVDYVAAHYMGNIYLFHMRDYENAIKYYELAARYSKPYHNKTSNYLAALIHQALAYYLSTSGDVKDNCKKAAICIKEVLKIAPDNIELVYQHAQYAAMSGDKDAAVKSLDKVIRNDPIYIVKILSEPDFSELANEIGDLVVTFQRELSDSYNRLFSNYMNSLNPVLAFYDSFSNLPEFKDKSEANEFLRQKEKAGLAVKNVMDIADVYSAGDIFSIYAAFERLSRIPVPEVKMKKTNILSYTTVVKESKVGISYIHSYYTASYSFDIERNSYIFSHFEYYAIGENVL
jgi:tetratricopeptide (TPR) repeat protein